VLIDYHRSVEQGATEGPETIHASLGKYRLLAELGSGGMATVFLAIMRGEIGFNKLVVVKVLKPHLELDADVLAMFHEEARLSARLNHPNVVQMYEVGKEGGHHMMVMEYLDGVALNQLVERARERGRPLKFATHLRIIHAALEGLHYAHELTDYDGTPLGVVHRDVSPHNIFVTFDGQVKVLDFGIAKLASSSHETRAGTIKGKIRYMSPEQMRGERVDRRADIFAVGAMLWEAATGERLWKGRGDVEILNQVLHERIPRPRDVAPHASDALDRICHRALARERAERYSSCVELQRELEELLEALGDRTSSRDIGQLLAREFDDVRALRRQIIDAQLTSANALGASYVRAVTSGEVEVPTLPALPVYGTASHSLALLGGEAGPVPRAKRVRSLVLGATAILAVAVVLTQRPRDAEQAVKSPNATPKAIDEGSSATDTRSTSSSAAPSEAPMATPPVQPSPKLLHASKAIATSASSAPPPSATPPSTSVSKKPPRPIDSANPWSK